MTYRQWSIVILASGYAAHPHLMERGSTAIEIEEWASGLSKAIIARMDKEKGDK